MRHLDSLPGLLPDKRSVRRRRRNEIIQKRYERVKQGHWHVKSPGHLAKNNTVCSCWMCGNPRKFFGKVTRQEEQMGQIEYDDFRELACY
jgi:hypothetical protein